MGKWFGKIGFGIDVKVEPDIYESSIVERSYYGELIQNRQRYTSAQTINDNLILSNRLKIVSEPFLQMNQAQIRYVTIRGCRWNVTSITEQYPNMILELGEVYTGDGPQQEKS